MGGQGGIKGIFSMAGDTAADGCRVYWKGEEREGGQVAMQRLDRDWLPTGESALVPRERLFREYRLEPDVWYELVTLRVTKGDERRARGEAQEARIEYSRALSVDEENIRANFGLGLVYLSQGETDKADYVFKRLVDMDETFAPRHKHLFNEFGMALRKRGMLARTLRYYRRALELGRDDENLRFNMARALLEKGEYGEMFEHLRLALEGDPGHAQSRSLARHALERGLRPDGEALALFRRLGVARAGNGGAAK
ncbi:tetratricopeptide repeat protein [Desulfohalovibrio reitneri]|uniref:tetratricopeptide repeat protein n=1 Tax=Desulfohalovibrio reitneri TaxID=1307759 RepID=UPI001F376187|nr:tetratricopeptide repeat protein [Desulfohalovibrio reitneri]